MSWFPAPTEGRTHPSTPGDAPPSRRSEARLSGTVPVGRGGQAGQRRVKCAWTARARELSSVPDDRRSGDEAPTAARRPRVRRSRAPTESGTGLGDHARGASRPCGERCGARERRRRPQDSGEACPQAARRAGQGRCGASPQCRDAAWRTHAGPETGRRAERLGGARKCACRQRVARVEGGPERRLGRAIVAR